MTFSEQKMEKKVKFLFDLEDGWAGPGTRKINRAALSNYIELFRFLPEEYRDFIEPYGTDQGAVRLEWYQSYCWYTAEIGPNNVYFIKLAKHPEDDEDVYYDSFDLNLFLRVFETGEIG